MSASWRLVFGCSFHSTCPLCCEQRMLYARETMQCAFFSCYVDNCLRFAHPHQPIPQQQILRRTPSVVIFGRASSCSRISPPLPPTSILLGALWGVSFLCPPVGARKVASWGPLGPLLGRSWVLLGPSWASLGPVLGLSWAILGPS